MYIEVQWVKTGLYVCKVLLTPTRYRRLFDIYNLQILVTIQEILFRHENCIFCLIYLLHC